MIVDVSHRCPRSLVSASGVGVVAFAEYAEESAVFTLEHPLDPGVAVRGKPRGIQPVAGREPVVHALAHRLELGGHQTRRLRARQAQRILQPCGGQPAQLAGRHRCRVGAEHGSGMPTAVEHLGAMSV